LRSKTLRRPQSAALREGLIDQRFTHPHPQRRQPRVARSIVIVISCTGLPSHRRFPCGLAGCGPAQTWVVTFRNNCPIKRHRADTICSNSPCPSSSKIKPMERTNATTPALLRSWIRNRDRRPFCPDVRKCSGRRQGFRSSRRSQCCTAHRANRGMLWSGLARCGLLPIAPRSAAFLLATLRSSHIPTTGLRRIAPGRICTAPGRGLCRPATYRRIFLRHTSRLLSIRTRMQQRVACRSGAALIEGVRGFEISWPASPVVRCGATKQ
jgi:hypothetical protein